MTSLMYVTEFIGKITPTAIVIEHCDLMQEWTHYLKEKGIKLFNAEDEFKQWTNTL